ncbi:MAG: hypothetical protein MZU95_15945 [Desulfomicrobium escambiense]|nr:hypothetical protein [Desulfomicrobium escambiense]
MSVCATAATSRRSPTSTLKSTRASSSSSPAPRRGQDHLAEFLFAQEALYTGPDHDRRQEREPPQVARDPRAPPPHRRRLPGLQADADPHGGGERGRSRSNVVGPAAGEVRRRVFAMLKRVGSGTAATSSHRSRSNSPAASSSAWRIARALVNEPAHPAGRRAHRQPRRRHDAGDHAALHSR